MTDQNTPNTLPDVPVNQELCVEPDTPVEADAPALPEEDVDADVDDIEPVGDGDTVQPTEPQQEKQKKSKARSPIFALLLEYVELFVTCLCAILIIFSFFFRVCTVSGTSMLPTFKHGELLLVSDLFYTPAQGDVIIFHQTSEELPRFNEPIIKRVIATSGQHVRIDFNEGTLEIDGVVIQEDYIQLIDTLGEEIGEYRVFAEHHMQMTSMPGNETHRIFEATVPEGCLFVMGDNRNNSSDSRTNVIGFVDERRVLGHVICRLTPTDAFGSVD